MKEDTKTIIVLILVMLALPFAFWSLANLPSIMNHGKFISTQDVIEMNCTELKNYISTSGNLREIQFAYSVANNKECTI